MGARQSAAKAHTTLTDAAPTLTPATQRPRTIPQHPQPEGYEAAAVLVPIDELVRWAGNPRDNTASVRKAMRSIRTYGFGAPLLARIDNRELIAGDTRIQAAMLLRKRGMHGLDKLPVRYMSLDELKAHGLAIADNRVGEDSEWVEEKRDAIVRDLDAADEDLAATGLDEEEIDASLGIDEDGDTPAPNEEADLEETYQVIIECTTEGQQAELLERLMAEGLKCRALVG
jgi:ParB-like chromosome segregation protein Spo0J